MKYIPYIMAGLTVFTVALLAYYFCVMIPEYHRQLSEKKLEYAAKREEKRRVEEANAIAIAGGVNKQKPTKETLLAGAYRQE